MEGLTTRERQVLLELFKNARTSDQEIARRIGTSRPTVIKIRQRLEKKLIKKYVATVDYEDIGLHVMATTLFRWNDFSKKKEMKAVFDYIRKLPFVNRFGSGVGMGSMTMIITSVHEDFKSYQAFWEDLHEKGGENIMEVQSFLANTMEMYKKFDHASVFIHYLQERPK
jgi:DNA-binding Lrp family transcriptional regulator